MIEHESRHLPHPGAYPYSMVIITVWEPNEHGGSTGRRFVNGTDRWYWIRDHAIELDNSREYDWSFDGFHFNDFTRGYFKTKDHQPPELVKLAMWSLERWAKDEGLIQ